MWLRARILGLSKRAEDHRPWTEADLALLRQDYSTQPAATLAERLGRTADAVNQQARSLRLLSGKTLINKSAVGDYFRQIDTTEKAYILGLLAADGCVSDASRITLGLQQKDEQLLRFVHARLAPKHSIHTSTAGFLSFSFTSRIMADDLSRWGVVPRKSRVLEWPAELGEMQRPFLLGYFDGDGSAHVQRGLYPRWSVCSGSRPMLVGLRGYVRAATGIELGKIGHRPNASLYEVGTSGAKACGVDEWLHSDGLGLDRKRYPPDVLARYQSG